MAELYCSDVLHKKVGEHCYKAGYLAGHLAGYKHCEKTMYSEEEVKILITKFDNFNNVKPLTFKEFQIWFNNNKK